MSGVNSIRERIPDISAGAGPFPATLDGRQVEVDFTAVVTNIEGVPVSADIIVHEGGASVAKYGVRARNIHLKNTPE